MATKPKTLADFAALDDLDAAVRGVQDFFGIDTGDTAAAHFSGFKDDEWPTLTRSRRVAILAEYAKAEADVVIEEHGGPAAGDA